MSALAITPQLVVKEISDAYIRDNFKKLSEYFASQNQLLNFKFIDLAFTQAADNLKVPHTLGFKPEDIIPTKVTGSGIITVNHGLCDSTNLDISVTGPCRFRFFVGAFWGIQTVRPGDKSDSTQYSAFLSADNSSIQTGVASISGGASYTVPMTDKIILVNSGIANTSIQLPDPTTVKGFRFTVKKTDTSSNLVNVSVTFSKGTIDELLTYPMSIPLQSADFVSDGVKYYVV